MFRLTLFIFCLAFLALAGGATGLGLALGALTVAVGCLAFLKTVWDLLFSK